MGRHSGASDSAQAVSEAIQQGRVGARRAALLAERAAASKAFDSTNLAVGDQIADQQNPSVQLASQANQPAGAAFGVSNPSSATEGASASHSSDSRGSALGVAGSFTLPPFSEQTSDALTLEIPYERSHSAAMRNSRFAAAMVVAAASMLGAASVVSADSPDNHATDLKGDDAASLNTLNVPTLDSATAQVTQSATFTVEVDGQTREITTEQPTLADALREADVVLGADDKVSGSLTEPVEDGATVTIVRVTTTSVSKDIVDAHATTEVEDAELPKGERVVETEGIDGLSVDTFDVTLHDGKEVARERTMSVSKEQRVDEVVRVGTKEEVVEAPAAQETAGDTAAAEAPDTASSSQTAAVGRAVPSGDAQSIAHSMMASYGWGDDQFSCLVPLWQRESGWRSDAANPTSSARGIPQAMMSVHFGANWQSNPAAIEWMNSPSQQISWGLDYIAGRYGNPCGAWSHSQATGWY